MIPWIHRYVYITTLSIDSGLQSLFWLCCRVVVFRTLLVRVSKLVVFLFPTDHPLIFSNCLGLLSLLLLYYLFCFCFHFCLMCRAVHSPSPRLLTTLSLLITTLNHCWSRHLTVTRLRWSRVAVAVIESSRFLFSQKIIWLFLNQFNVWKSHWVKC